MLKRFDAIGQRTGILVFFTYQCFSCFFSGRPKFMFVLIRVFIHNGTS